MKDSATRDIRLLTREERTKWSDALRSGKYKQARMMLAMNEHGDRADSDLHNIVAYCCLGVCAVVLELGYRYPSGYGLVSVEDEVWLMHLNDRQLATFAEIADVVDTLPVLEDTQR